MYGSFCLASYPDVRITNRTGFRAEISAKFLSWFCRDNNNMSIPPGDTLWISRGACLLTKISARVFVPVSKLRAGNISSNAASEVVSETNDYSSSGTSYGDNFAITQNVTYTPAGVPHYEFKLAREST